jgi:hypothetical protein
MSDFDAAARALESPSHKMEKIFNSSILSTLVTVAFLGFGEACVRCRKPVPLRFAWRFAFHNVLPSMVWRTLDTSLLANAAKIPVVEIRETQSSLLAEAFRVSRYILASYGVAYHLFRTCHDEEDSITHKHARPREKVLRLSSSASNITRFSLQKHPCGHIVPFYFDTDDDKRQQHLVDHLSRQKVSMVSRACSYIMMILPLVLSIYIYIYCVI